MLRFIRSLILGICVLPALYRDLNLVKMYDVGNDHTRLTVSISDAKARYRENFVFDGSSCRSLGLNGVSIDEVLTRRLFWGWSLVKLVNHGYHGAKVELVLLVRGEAATVRMAYAVLAHKVMGRARLAERELVEFRERKLTMMRARDLVSNHVGPDSAEVKPAATPGKNTWNDTKL